MSPLPSTAAVRVDEAPDTGRQPRGLAILFTTEMGERFSFYGMRSLLLLFMLRALLLPGHAERVWGLAGLRHGLETVFGPLSAQAFGSQIVGLYGGLVYLTPIFGGLLADRLLGARRTVVLGAAIMAVGHFLMAYEPMFLVALTLLILGNGAFKPNVSTQVGRLYPPDDPRVDRGYSIFYLGINLGAFLAPLVCGTLGETIGWDYGFAAAGLGMSAALAVYLVGLRRLPADPPRGMRVRDGRAVRPALIVVAALFVPVTLFWATYYQMSNVVVLWADTYTDRTIDLLGWRATIPTTWFQAVNPLMIFGLTPLLVALWRRQSARGREPSTIVKMALGCVLIALAHLVLALAAWQKGAAPASWLWLIAYIALLTIGELYLSPIGLALVSKIAPAGYVAMIMGLWLATSFTGGVLSGWMGTFWDERPKADFFLLMAALGGIAAALVSGVSRYLAPLVVDRAAIRRVGAAEMS